MKRSAEFRAKAKKLRVLATKYDQMADLEDEIADSSIIAELLPEDMPKLARKKPSRQRKSQLPRGKTRLDQIKDVLAKNGALTRGDISKIGGIPIGTLATYLNEEKGFERTPDGKWKLAGHEPNPELFNEEVKDAGLS